MKAGGGDKKSGTANLPDPIHDQGEAREKAAEITKKQPLGAGRKGHCPEVTNWHAPHLNRPTLLVAKKSSCTFQEAR